MPGGDPKLTQNDEALLAMKAARMSTSSIAAVMRWSEAKVANRLAALQGQTATPVEDRPPTPSRAERLDLAHVATVSEAGGFAELATVVAPPPFIPPPEPPPAEPRRAAPPANPVRQVAPPPRRAGPHDVEQLRPMSARCRGFVARFRAASWTIDEIADLFNLDPAQVAGVTPEIRR